MKAQYSLGVIYNEGLGVPQDYTKAKYYFELAAKQGETRAQFNVGLMYHGGQGVSKNYKKAMYYFELAANQGHASAQVNLGNMHYYGQGIPQNYKKTVYYYKQAAEQGNARAIGGMALSLLQGQGVPQNEVHGYGYVLVMLALEPNAKAFQEIKPNLLNKLSSKQIEEGQTLAAKMWEDLEEVKKR